MYEEWETIRSDNAPGLVAVVKPDYEWWENPLGWVGIRECGVDNLSGMDGERSDDPGLIECPNCHHPDGSTIGSEPGQILGVRKGPVGPETYDSECPCCEGWGERRAKNEAEWCKAKGVAAAVPVDYTPDGSRPGVWIRDWDESYSSIFYAKHEEGREWTADAIRDQIHLLEMSLTEGFYYYFVELDEDSDLPPDILGGVDSAWMGCGGFLGHTDAEYYAEEGLEMAGDHVKKELAEREEWAKRDVVTA